MQTLGSWDVSERHGSVEVRAFDAEYDEPVCTLADTIHAPENARLIAAAPDMLEALRRIVETVESMDFGGEPSMADMNRARAAIAKAEGR